MTKATAFWIERPGQGGFRSAVLAEPGQGEVLVRTSHTAVSRGTEATVFQGRVPAAEHARMRAPFQEGDFPAPVKYGYLNVGVVEQGPQELLGTSVFTLFPHQSAFVVPADAVHVLPDGVPPRRAVLAGAVETAVNILWDAAPLLGDRVTVIGAGMIGCCVARLAGRIPGVRVTLVDVDAGRSTIARSLGVPFATPDATLADQDLVIEASGSEEGLSFALRSAVDDGEVIVASWFGDRAVALPLGGDFHSRRLSLRSSQVGQVSLRRRHRRTTHARLALALDLLRDEAFDALLTGSSPWQELPEVARRLAAGTSKEICHTIDWSEEPCPTP
ncbi:zinc-dependent alcohol dehydrogenase [Microbacterium tumbae]